MSVLVYMSCLCVVLLGKLSVLVSANYVVQVRMISYIHPSNTRSDGQCCDSEPGNGLCSGGERCDTYFIYCLMPRASTAIGCSNATSGFTLVSSVSPDGADIDFSQPTALGLPNPFLLTGISTAWESAQLYIQVTDSDNNSPDDVIARYRFELSLAVGSTTTLTASSTNNPSINVRITVLCAPFYSGSSCDILDHCESNSVTCSDRRTCVNGFNSFTCNCNSPYFGANCESQNFCFNRNCNTRGTCNNGVDFYTCVCDPGYTGADCEDIDNCEGQSCSGNGDCMNEVNSYTCVCNAGYTGADCEDDIDECLLMESVCSGRGNCSHGIATFTCSCDPGYTGQRCETDIDDCVDMKCSGNGGCIDMVNMFLCDCDPGYTGAYCETDIDDCVNRNCSGTGVCVDGVNSFSCECVSGFTGEMCSIQDARSYDATAIIIGGVVGGLVGIVLIAVIAVLIVIILKNKKSSQYVKGGETVDNDIQCQHNVVYGVFEMTQPNTLTTPFSPQEYDYPLCTMSEPFQPVYESVNEKLTIRPLQI
ncbi:delta-like protein C [Halichondria panicea]|uniref:delta-like protein C n=1 Tax=Halichondria panicea TaxID=6063 RepID=UPI00312BC34E